MDSNAFITTTHAKCILAGEHAVLRGHSALVFPIKCKLLELSYHPAPENLAADYRAPYGENLLIFLWKIVALSLDMLKRNSNEVTGQFFLKNAIPMGCGLGFSSAICVAITRWLVWQGWLDHQESFQFARSLEDNFHGKSSGVDIAGALTELGILYSMQEGAKALDIKWKPLLYLSSSKHYCSTEKCIKQVEKISLENASLAEHLDHEMAASVTLAVKALALDPATGFTYLTQAINKANTCFKQWGLLTPALEKHIDYLLAAGAVAAKPTGSGGGGYILSLWREPPINTLLSEKLKSVF